MTKGDFDVLEVQGIDPKGGWLYYIASPDNPAQRYLFRTRLDGKGKPGAASARRASRAPTCTTSRPTTSTPSRPTPASAIRRSSAWSGCRAPVDPDPGGQPAAPGPGRAPPARPPSSGSPSPAEDGLEDAGCADEAGRLRLHPEVPAAVLRLRRAREHRGRTTCGAATTSGTRCSPRRATWWPSWTTAARPPRSGRAFRKAIYGQLGVLETRDQADRRADAAQRSVRGPEPDRHLGLELRRLHDASTCSFSTPSSTGPASPSRR